MVKLLKQLLSSEQGQALPIVLCLLAVGGLTIAASLNYATTSLKGSEIIEEKTEGIYAAGAGVEYALWSLEHGVPQAENLTENVNQMAVRNIETETDGQTYIFYLGSLTGYGGSHAGHLSVNGTLSSVGGNRYQYAITITLLRELEKGAKTIHLQEVGARIPVGYSDNNSATRSDGGPLLDDKSPGNNNPVTDQDGAGAYLLRWLWTSNNRPTLQGVGDNFTLTFYITGTEPPEGEYAWTIADPVGYGLYGEITGVWYQISAEAVRPADNRTTVRIVADVVKQAGAIYILSWQITN